MRQVGQDVADGIDVFGVHGAAPLVKPSILTREGRLFEAQGFIRGREIFSAVAALLAAVLPARRAASVSAVDAMADIG